MCVVILLLHTFAVSFFQFIMVSISRVNSYKMMIWLVGRLVVWVLSYLVLVLVGFCVCGSERPCCFRLEQEHILLPEKEAFTCAFVHGKLEIVTPTGMVWW